MSKRDLLITGIKLMGIYIVVFSIFSLIPKITTMLYYFLLFPGFIFSNADQDSQKMMMNIAMKQSFFSTGAQMLWAVIKVLIGIYFCKKGELVIKLFLGKEALNPTTNS